MCLCFFLCALCVSKKGIIACLDETKDLFFLFLPHSPEVSGIGNIGFHIGSPMCLCFISCALCVSKKDVKETKFPGVNDLIVFSLMYFKN